MGVCLLPEKLRKEAPGRKSGGLLYRTDSLFFFNYLEKETVNSTSVALLLELVGTAFTV